jgi:hypothetical protein
MNEAVGESLLSMSLSHGREKRLPAGVGRRSLRDCSEREPASGAVDGGRAPAAGVLAGGQVVAAGSRLSRPGPGSAMDAWAGVVAAGWADWCLGSGHLRRAARVGEGGVLPGACGRWGRALAGWGGWRHKGRTCTCFRRSLALRECGGMGRRCGGAGAVVAAGWTGGSGSSRSECV